MNLEIFSHSKYKNGVSNGDDVILHLPDRVFAVFDGATDARNSLFNGISVGRVAALTVAAEISSLVINNELSEQSSIAHILDRLQASLKNKFSHDNFSPMPSTTAAMVFEFIDGYRLIVMGDSSVRINGLTVYSKKKLIDEVSTFARIYVFKYLKNKLKLKNDEIELLVRRVSFLGFDLAVEEAVLTDKNRQEIIKASANYTGLIEHENEVANFLNAGIQGQHIYANNAVSVLGYGCLNSTKFLQQDVIDISIPKLDVKMIEIYSDGYVSEPRNGANIAGWENEFNRVEKLDYHKLDKFPSIKGSTLDQFSDDRAIIILSE